MTKIYSSVLIVCLLFIVLSGFSLQQKFNTQSMEIDEVEVQQEEKNKLEARSRLLVDCSQLKKCSTCDNSGSGGKLVCTKCALDANGKDTFLLMNGICYPPDNMSDQRAKQMKDNDDNKWLTPKDKSKGGVVSYNGNCIPCQAGCKVCNTTSDFTKCTQCIPGYYLDSATSICGKCDDICLTCDPKGSNICLTCYPAYVIKAVSGVNTCAKCTDSRCAVCSSEAVCTNCKNFYFLASTDKTCKSCSTNCRICTDQKTCTQCTNGYVLNKLATGEIQCNMCVDGCASCKTIDTCEKCYPGLFLNSATSKCQKCSTNCWSCSSASVCSSCVLGTYLVSNACVQGISNCAEMKSDGTCNKCLYGYTLTTAKDACNLSTASSDMPFVCKQTEYLKDLKCQACTVTIDNCQSCISSACVDCKDGYYITNKGAACSACSSITGCKLCRSSIFCGQCSDGYFMELDIVSGVVTPYGNCLKCDDNCLTCNEKQTYCTSCKSGLSLSTARTCVASNSGTFTILLNYDFSKFLEKMDSVKAQVAGIFAKKNGLSTSAANKMVSFTKISSGSVLVSGSVYGSSDSNVKDNLNSLQASVTSGSSLANIPVISTSTSQTQANADQNTNTNTNSNSDSSSTNTGLIVGLVIGLGGGVLLIIGGIVGYHYWKKNRLNPKEKAYGQKTYQQKDDNSEKISSVNGEPIPMTSQKQIAQVNNRKQGPKYYNSSNYV